MITNIIEQLKRDEGFVDHVYKDTVGKRTVGYGHNLDAKPIAVPDVVTEEWATDVLNKDVLDTQTELSFKISWLGLIDEVRVGVLINMAFNMGTAGLLEFKKMLFALKIHDYTTAAAEMIISSWYTQVGVRAKRLAAQMVAGTWM